jgi:hypothetical protein
LSKINCWEHKRCGREQGGDKTEELGVCPASVDTRIDGTNSGKNGGRACWLMSGTLCNGSVQGIFAEKAGNCKECDFYKIIDKEETIDYRTTKEILTKLDALV